MTKRDPHADNNLIDDMQDLPTPQPTGVEGRDKRDGGDLPTPPQRHR